VASASLRAAVATGGGWTYAEFGEVERRLALAALASPPATKALDSDPFPCRSLRHVVYAALLHFGLETADPKGPHPP
jgi:hypothetical protein